ncbi:MAG TPA: N-acetylmuramoyl-L-alanine amidase [Spirochaetia bacterium]|nr:N-acetylmuramoyl-L-alanine amidase [Spirochaetia bacterium]
MSIRRAAGLLVVVGLAVVLAGAQRLPRVGVQAGHWRVAELPAEQSALRGDTGAQWGAIREADVDLRIARLVVEMLGREGVQAELLPATVPAAYSADAFVAVHAEGAPPTGRSGWKVAEAWFASDASRLLRADVAGAYGQITGLPEDRYGVTKDMRDYFAFDWTRFSHAVAPATPAVIVETGFLGAPMDRRTIVEHPEVAAAAIAFGIVQFLTDERRLDSAQFQPDPFFRTTVSAAAAIVRFYPDQSERIVGTLAAGTEVFAFTRRDGWAEIAVRGHQEIAGWVPESDLVPPGR